MLATSNEANLLTVRVKVLKRGAISTTPPASRAHCRIPRPSRTSGRDRHMPALARTRPGMTKSSADRETLSWCMTLFSSGRPWLAGPGACGTNHL